MIPLKINCNTTLCEIYSYTGRPSMDILVRSWQRCHGKILSREPCSQEKFYCKILFGQKRSERKSTKINIFADLYC